MSGHTRWPDAGQKRSSATEAQHCAAEAALDLAIARYSSSRGLPRRLCDRWHDRRRKGGLGGQTVIRFVRGAKGRCAAAPHKSC
jgi:hypothetical protein